MRDEVRLAIVDIGELKLALDSLPDEKTVHVRVETDGMPEPFLADTAAGAGAGGVQDMADSARDARDAFAVLDEIIRQDDEAMARWGQDTRVAGEAAAQAGEDAAGSAASAGAQADALRDARDAAARYAAAQDAAAASAAHLEAAAVSAAADIAAADELLADASRDAAAADAELAGVEEMLADASRAAADAQRAVIDSNVEMALTQGAVAAATSRTSQATREAASAARHAYRVWGVFPLTWHAIHWAVTGVSEALAVVIPAMIAGGDAVAVGWEAGADAVKRMAAVWQAAGATSSYLGQSLSGALGQGIGSFTASAGKGADAGDRLGNSLRAAQDAAQPHVYELLGAAVDGASGSMGTFASTGNEVLGILDQFAAKTDIELGGPGGLGAQMAQQAVPDLVELSQVFGNLGHAVASAAGEMPGMAEVLLRVLDDGTRLLGWVLHFQGAMEAAFAAHEIYMWGGVARSVLAGVAGALASAGASAGTFAVRMAEMTGVDAVVNTTADAAMGLQGALAGTASFIAGPWGLAIGGAVIALALFGHDLVDAKDKTEQWVSSLESSVASAQGLQQIATTYQALQAVTQANTAAQRELGEVSAQTMQTAQTGSLRGAFSYAETHRNAVVNAQALSTAQQALNQDFSNEIGNVKLLSQEYKISYAEAAQLAGDAGISLTQSLKGNGTAAQIANQQIKNLIAGYGGMASVGSELGQDINAVSFAAEIQNGDVAKLNQAWDTFISTVQSPSSTFLAFAQSLSQFSSDAEQAGASMDGLGGTAVKTASPMTSAALQLQSDFNSSVTSAEQMLDSMRTVAAVTGNGGPLVAGIKDTVAALIPMAGKNEAARAQLFALAQEAGGPASGSLASLAKWAGSTKDPLTALYDLSMKGSAALQNLGADTQALAATIQSTLNQALVSEAQALTDMPAKMDAYLSDLKKYGPSAAVTQAALDTLNSSQAQANALATTAIGQIPELSGKVTEQGKAFADTHAPQTVYIDAIQAILDKAPGASGDIEALTTAVRHHGTASSQFETARQNLVNYLKQYEPMSVVRQQVDELTQSWKNLLALPSSKNIMITYTEETNIPSAGPAPGPWAAGEVPSTAGKHASGWRVPGYGGGDSVPAWVEPGEAIVPKELVPDIAPFLGAHHVPGFAEGGIPGSGHLHPVTKPWGMADVAALWAAEIWGTDLKRHGEQAPVGPKEAAALLASFGPGHGVPRTGLASLLGTDERGDSFRYLQADAAYWEERKKLAALLKTEAKDAARIHRDEARDLARGDMAAFISEDLRLAAIEKKDNPLAWADRRQVGALLKEMGYFQPGGPAASYDRGGYLPVGLSMAYNGTGRPEPVGAAAAKPEVHVHLHGDLARDGLWEDMQVRTFDYNYTNNGRPTGIWQPGS